MKNNKIIIFLIIFYIFFLQKNTFADAFKFETTEIQILDNGKTIKAINGGKVSTDDNVEIFANIFEYDKELNSLIAEGKVKLIDKDNQFINIGYGKEISIKELTKLICKITNFHGTIACDKTKPNGTYRKLIDSSRMRKINWKPKISLTEGIGLVIKELNNLR